MPSGLTEAGFNLREALGRKKVFKRSFLSGSGDIFSPASHEGAMPEACE